MFWSPDDCSGEGDDWQLMGWYNFNPGDCGLVYANDLADLNRYWYYHGRAADGARWTGSIGLTPVSNDAFDRCWGLPAAGPDDFEIGFRLLDVGSSDDYTLSFIR
jgi:hypothetical protein